ncbi:hypothetical protein [Gilvibacter sediminis]|uniref:hypothetical protein n=1 Tax=Gilvibacter sediminis TaxID=379071 RepID=UPI00235050EB|nr:hypothetical protein [Gilvibacter sediminis]MDC7998419.1 hypothetical protein [Gilvibacter sediminis]
MKLILSFLVLTFMTVTSKSVVGKYQINDDFKIDILILKRNGKFVYEDRGDSCWTWTDRKGNWELKSDTLILNEKRPSFVIDEESLEVVKEESVVKEHKFILEGENLRLFKSDLFQKDKIFSKL